MSCGICGILLLAALSGPLANARVTRIDIKTNTPTFTHRQFGKIGTYQKIIGRYYGELDPKDPAFAQIVDIDLAQRNANGKIEYDADFYILKPAKMSRSTNTALYDFGNRGDKYLLHQYNDTDIISNPKTASDAGNGFLMQHGIIMVWSGFLGDVEPNTDRLSIRLPIATKWDGSKIQGTIWDECANDFWAKKIEDYNILPFSYPIPDWRQGEEGTFTRSHYQVRISS
jgi:hypothetical protein